MKSQQVLDIIGIFTVVVTLVSAVGSQLLKKDAPTGPDGRKRLSQAATVALALAVVSFAAGLATAIIKVNMGIEADRLAEKKKFDDAQAKRLEEIWKSGVSTLLTQANSTISKNLTETLTGFKTAQDLQLQTQASLFLARQRILEQQLQQTTRIIVAGQPLTSLNVAWTFSGPDGTLDRLLKDGAEAIAENAGDTQGGVTVTPLELMDYQHNLQPLLFHLAQRTMPLRDDWRSDPDTDHVAVMVLLDDASNAVLPFGDLLTDAEPAKDSTAAGKTGTAPSYPFVTRSGRTYLLNWALDPATLSGSLAKANAGIATTSALPTTLKIAVLFNYKTLPITSANYADIGATSIWRPLGQGNARQLPANALLRGSSVRLMPNGYGGMQTTYRFARVYQKDLFNEDGEDAEVSCFVIEYVRS